MFTYLVPVVALVALSSIALAFIMKRNSLLNAQVVAAISLSSIAVSLVFPLLLNAFLNSAIFFTAGLGVLLAFLTTFVVYIILIFLISLVISSLLVGKRAGRFIKYLKKSALYRWINDVLSRASKMIKKINGSRWDGEPVNAKQAEQLIEHTDEQVLTPLQAEYVETPQQVEQMQQLRQDMEQDNFASEKLVDSGQNIDKMGIGEEDFYPDKHLSIEEYLDEAFKMKQAGDLEGAIQQYMHALEKNPAKDLVFWIILDICVLYKTLGQAELAREILEGYINSYSGVMNSSVKGEIERNLSYI